MSQAAEWEDGAGRDDERLERLAAAIPDGFALVRDERVVWANARMVEMTGCGSLRALVGTASDELFEDTGRGLPDAAAPRALECGLRREGGERRTVVCRPAWTDPAGCSAWIVEDLTHVRVLERELLRQSKDLHRAHRELAAMRERLRVERAEREELMTVVSHELRTPVTVISGYNRLLLSGQVGELNAEQKRFLEESAKSCQRLDGFIGNLLEASRQSAGDDAVEVAWSRLEPVLSGVLDLLRPLLVEHGFETEIRIGTDADRARFDAPRIEQVLTNLVVNALKHARSGKRVEIETRALVPASGPAAGRAMVEVAVCDTGPGIAPADRERIFHPYVRAGEESRAGGLGLGLAICRRLVAAHGGSLTVSERAGGGSRFAFTLPASEDAPAAAGEA